MLITRYTKADSPLEGNHVEKGSFLYARPFFDGTEEVYGSNLWLIEVKKAEFCMYLTHPHRAQDAAWVELDYIPPREDILGNVCTFEPQDVVDWVLIT